MGAHQARLEPSNPPPRLCDAARARRRLGKSTTMSTLFTIRKVNDATFPHHGMSGRLDELLLSPGSQPVRCVATAPGHVVVSVAGGKYLHAFSARTPHPSRRAARAAGEDAATKPAAPEHPRDAFVESQTRLSPELEPELLETSALLSFHGASPVSRVVFVPAGASAAENAKTPLALLAVQEDGGVAAWRWVEMNANETDDENDDERARWCACVPPSFAGGPPLIVEPPANAIVSHSIRGGVVDASLVTTFENGRRRVKLACLTSGHNFFPDREESRAEGPRSGMFSPWLVLLDVCFLDDLRHSDDRGHLRNKNVGRRKSGETEKRKPDETSEKINRHEALAPVPRASAVLSAGGDEFWVVANGGGAVNGPKSVATRWAVGEANGRTRATRRVDLSAAAAAADAAAAAADGVSPSRAVAAERTLGRLATCLHYPSRELLAVTDRGNVLCLSPGLRGFDSGTDDVFTRDASAFFFAAEREKSAKEKEEHSVRHVGRLRGFADDFANPAKSWHVSNALVAHGPFLYLAWRRRGSAETLRAGEVAFFHEPPETDDSYAEDRKSDDALPTIASAVSAYHLSSGVSLGTVPLPALPALAGRAANGADEKNFYGTTERTKTLSADAPKRAYDRARLVDGGAFWGPPAFLLATETCSSAGGVFVVAPAPAAATLARVYVGEDADATRREHRRALSSTPFCFRERAHAEMSFLRSARRECAWFGGSLERLDASLALATAELDIDARARGTPRLAYERLFSDDAEKSLGKNQTTTTSEETTEEVFLSPTRARVAEPALVLRARASAETRKKRRNDDAWRVVADETRAFFRKNYPRNDLFSSANGDGGDADARFAFAVFSELGAAEARDVHGALAAGGAAGADADASRKSRDDVWENSLTERETNRPGPGAGDARFARAGLAALDAAASAAAPWEIPREDDREKDKQQTPVDVFEAEGRETLRAVARLARRLGSETETHICASISDDVSETRDDFRDVLSFLSTSSRARGDGASSEAPPSSSLEAAAALLATTTTVIERDEKARDERDAFA